MRLLDDWRKDLDSQECAAAILMDLSKAFDCLSHGLLLGKLKAYGLCLFKYTEIFTTKKKTKKKRKFSDKKF